MEYFFDVVCRLVSFALALFLIAVVFGATVTVVCWGLLWLHMGW